MEFVISLQHAVTRRKIEGENLQVGKNDRYLEERAEFSPYFNVLLTQE